MISVLIVDDDLNKRRKIKEFAQRCLSDEGSRIDEAEYVVDAAVLLKEVAYDLLILDVNLPMRKGEAPNPSNGAELLRQIQVRRFIVPTHVIGLTAFTEVIDECSSAFEEFTWSLVFFDQASDGWQRRIANKIEHIIAGKAIAEDLRYECDLAIISALEDVEMKEVMALDAGWRRRPVKGDDTIYFEGVFSRDAKSLRVISGASIQMGMPAATGLAMKMCAEFKPKYLAMCGIAAGVKGGIGDVLIADKTWDYGSGKSRRASAPEKVRGKGRPASDGTAFGGAIFEPAPTAISLDGELCAKVGVFLREAGALKRIESKWSGERPPKGLEALVGGIASGAAVLENRPLIDIIKSHERKVIGIDMEAYGVFLAARVCPAPRPKPFVVKSVCDFGDPKKKDKWQRYAAFTSSQFLYEFALAEL
jgi:nucleoside phosphorylase/CheY-like chemotaxis protein